MHTLVNTPTFWTFMCLHLLEHFTIECEVEVVRRVLDSILMPLRDISWVWVRLSDRRVRATAAIRAFVSAAIRLPL